MAGALLIGTAAAGAGAHRSVARAAHAAKTLFAIKMGKAVPSSGDITYGGAGQLVFISDFGVTADDKDDVKFTATFVVIVLMDF